MYDMDIKFVDKKLSQIKADCEIIFVVSGNLKHKWVRDKAALDQLGFRGKADEAAYLPNKHRLYVGIESADLDELRLGAALAVRTARNKKLPVIKIGLYGDDPAGAAQAMAEGFVLGEYEFDRYKKEKSKNNIRRIFVGNEIYSNLPVDAVPAAQAVKSRGCGSPVGQLRPRPGQYAAVRYDAPNFGGNRKNTGQRKRTDG